MTCEPQRRVARLGVAHDAVAVTLLLELFDSVSSQIIGRAADRRTAGNRSFGIQANRVTNRADAQREFRVWADKFIEFLDSHYVSAD